MRLFHLFLTLLSFIFLTACGGAPTESSPPNITPKGDTHNKTKSDEKADSTAEPKKGLEEQLNEKAKVQRKENLQDQVAADKVEKQLEDKAKDQRKEKLQEKVEDEKLDKQLEEKSKKLKEEKSIPESSKK